MGKETVELVQIGQWNLRHGNRLCCIFVEGIRRRGFSRYRQSLTAVNHPLRRDDLFAAALRDRPPHTIDGMFVEQLQYADELTRSGEPAVACFEVLAQPGEVRRELPVAVDFRVIQTGRFPRQRRQVMERIEHLLAFFIRPLVPGDHLAVRDDYDLIDVGFHRDGGEGVSPRHAVSVVLPGDGLILVHLARLGDRRVEHPLEKWNRRGSFFFKSPADRFAPAADDALLVALAAAAEMVVQLIKVAHFRHRRRPVALQVFYAILHVRLLIAPRRHAEQRLEVVMAGQRLIMLVQLPVAPLENRHGDRLGIVPPQFLGNAVEVREGFHRAVQNRFHLFAGQRDRERAVRPRPSNQEHRHLPAAFGEVDVDVAEVGFRPPTRLMRKRKERFPLTLTMLRRVAPAPGRTRPGSLLPADGETSSPPCAAAWAGPIRPRA